MKDYKLKKQLLTFVLTTTLLSTVGCGEKELVADEQYDIIDTSKSSLEHGLEKRIDIPREDFKLVVNFSCDDTSKREWRITSDKFLYMNIHTSGLEDGTQVYIDNIHIDTSIKSKYAVMDGIVQDSMDDRIHNSLMLGFPINNNTYYYGVNAIEGCNQDFIQGTYYGYNGYSSVEIEQKRYTESDYMDLGVWGNKISVVIDLLVKHENELEFSNVSVCTDFVVAITNLNINIDEEQKKPYTK